jgi:hypothetical protein
MAEVSHSWTLWAGRWTPPLSAALWAGNRAPPPSGALWAGKRSPPLRGPRGLEEGASPPLKGPLVPEEGVKARQRKHALSAAARTGPQTGPIRPLAAEGVESARQERVKALRDLAPGHRQTGLAQLDAPERGRGRLLSVGRA